jgi:hypothetical protein
VRKYKITYTDHKVDVVQADSYRGSSYWFLFFQGQDVVMRAKAKDVRSISVMDESDDGPVQALPQFGFA